MVLAACDTPETTISGPDVTPAFSTADDLQLRQGADEVDAQLRDFMAVVNEQLEADGADYRVEVAEWLGADLEGREVFFMNRGTMRLGDDFVPRDPRRTGWSGIATGPEDDVTWAVDRTGDAVPPKGGLSAIQTTQAITRAMATWDEVQCSNLPLAPNPDFGIDIGLLAFLNGLGGSPFVFADVQHAGWRDIDFDPGVLGATFTFIFIDGTGAPTDIDGNGKWDVAFREIYYDPSWDWAVDGHMDVESVALHEMGHGLSQAHFGALFGTFANGKLHFAPYAVMNPAYTRVQQSLLGTDLAGHCSIWGGWPND
jgi:hypothetical protein